MTVSQTASVEMLGLIDTHCHLNTLEHKTPEQAIIDARQKGVTRMICIGAGAGLASASEALALAQNHPGVFATVGIHPHDAQTDISITQLEELAAHPRVVAIGETGLDFFRDWSPFAEQERVFIETIELAKQLRKPLVIHCREAHERTIELLRLHRADEVGGVFHCFAESAEMAQRVADLGFLVSLTGILTFKAAQTMRDEVARIPLSQIMLETDCPYMAPVPYRGQPSEPAHVLEIAQTLAALRQVPLEEIARSTSANAEKLFCLDTAFFG